MIHFGKLKAALGVLTSGVEVASRGLMKCPSFGEAAVDHQVVKTIPAKKSKPVGTSP